LGPAAAAACARHQTCWRDLHQQALKSQPSPAALSLKPLQRLRWQIAVGVQHSGAAAGGKEQELYNPGLTYAAVLYVLVVDGQKHVCTQLCLQAAKRGVKYAQPADCQPLLLCVSVMLTLSRVRTPLLSNTCVTRCTQGTAAEVNTLLGKRPALRRHRTPNTLQTLPL
jgi:hypothetical protein